MGQTIAKFRAHHVTRRLQRYNIDSRTEKLLNKEKPKTAPKFQSDKELLELIRKDMPQIVEAANKKDTELLQKLDSIYVTSEDPDDSNPDINRIRSINPNRPFPSKQKQPSKPLNTGFSEAAGLYGSAKQGKLSLDVAKSIMSEYSRKEESSTLISLANEHRQGIY